jgi:hypothetical protein
MPSRAVASALAAFLEEWDLREARDLADYLDDFESISPGDNARTLIAYLRSKDFKSAVRATVAADVMGVAQASTELRLLGSELRLMEESESRLSAANSKPEVGRRPRPARVKLHVHVGLPQLARRSIKTQTDVQTSAERPTPSRAARQQRNTNDSVQLLKQEGQTGFMPVLIQGGHRGTSRSIPAFSGSSRGAKFE